VKKLIIFGGKGMKKVKRIKLYNSFYYKRSIILLGILIHSIIITSILSAQSLRLGEYCIDSPHVMRLNNDGSMVFYDSNRPNIILSRGTYSIRGDRITFVIREATGALSYLSGLTAIYIINNSETMVGPDGNLDYIRPSLVVSDFIVQARDINMEEVLIVKNMFINAFNVNRAVNAIENSTLINTLSSINFLEGDWSNSTKTTQIGTMLNAKYLLGGTIIQLGNSISLTITIRDIKTLNIITTVQRVYSLENIWDHSIGIPGTLSEIVNDIANGIGCGLMAIGPAIPMYTYEVTLIIFGGQMGRRTHIVEAESPAEAEREARRRHQFDVFRQEPIRSVEIRQIN